MIDKSTWQFTRRFDPPEADIVIMCPWAFVRFMWHTTSKEHRQWPVTLDTGIVWGIRWPWKKQFKERSRWLKRQELPFALVGGPMDQVFMVRAVKDLGMLTEEELKKFNPQFLKSHPEIRHIGATVKDVLNLEPKCSHILWNADCSNCARKALRLAIRLKTKYEPIALLDPYEDPRARFLRQEQERKAQLAEIERRRLEASHDDKV